MGAMIAIISRHAADPSLLASGSLADLRWTGPRCAELINSGNEKRTIGRGTKPFVDFLVPKGAEIVHRERPFISSPKQEGFR
jgi:hypothetical protein